MTVPIHGSTGLRVEGYHHTDLAPIQAMGPRHETTVDRNIPVIAEVEECVA
jgi:hypothetical protein